MFLTKPPRFFLTLLILLAKYMVVEIKAEEGCCPRKMVGSVSYTLQPENFHQKLPHQCLNGCVYTVSGTSSPKFCFGAGSIYLICNCIGLN